MKISAIRKTVITTAFAISSSFAMNIAHASVIYEFSNAGNYIGSTVSANGIFATAEFTDVTGGVQLVMKALSNISNSQYVNDWGFNLTSTSNPTITSISWKAGKVASDVSNASSRNPIDSSADSVAFGDALKSGYFDLTFSFSTNGKDIGPGESSTYLLTGKNLSSDDFLVANGKNIFATAKIEGGNTNSYFKQINNGGVATATVPEPTTVALLGLGLLGFAASRRKSAKSKNA